MNEQEKYLEYQKGKEQAEASGINALVRDVELTSEKAVEGVKDTGDRMVDEVDDDVSNAFDKVGKDTKDTVKDVKDSVKQDIGIGNAKSSRFDTAASGKGLTDNIKESGSEKDDEIYVSRKRARYQ